MRHFLLRAVTTSSLVVASMEVSIAQTVDSGNPGVSEVIVTAQKRPENVDTVPIMISVLTNQDLDQTVIDSTQKLEWATPGLVFGNTNGFAEPYIRGIGTDLITPGQDSPIGFYLDGVYLPFASDLLQQFGDLSRIEILKGPQGTLYGRNTTGGAINIITRDPQQAFSADATVTGGNLGYAKATTYVTGGLAEGLSANFASVYATHNGFYEVINTGGRSDNLDQFGLRGKIKYDFDEDWNAVLGADYLEKHDTSDTVNTVLVNGTVPMPPGVGPSLRPYDTYTNDDPHRSETDFGGNLTVRGRASWADFTSITGFRDDYMKSNSDGDNTSLALLAFSAIEGEQQFTQEFQLTSYGSQPLQWIGGLYFLDAIAYEGPVDVWSDIPITEPPNAAVLEGRSRITSYAGYGQASYELPDGFKLIAGVRTTNEERKLTRQTDFTTDFLAPGATPFETSKSWTSTNPKGTFQWENPGQMLYASYSTGFKAGSYNLISPGSPPLDPEKITAYEIGGKHDLPFLNQAHLDWAVFYYNYKNIQVSVLDAATGGITASQNAASSINRGVDLDLAVPIIRNLTATVSAEYLDARYESYPNAAVDDIVNGVFFGTKSVDASGNREERAPLLTSTVQVRWLLPVGPGNIATTATYYHNSGFYLDPGDELQQKAYNLANLNIQYAPSGNRWSVAAWVNNAFNATVLGGAAASNYAVAGFYNDPRLFGLSASVHY